MTSRITTRVVTFVHPFTLGAPDDAHPAGSYSVETEEELLEGLSFPAYRRTRVSMQRVDAERPRGLLQIETIDPEQLDRAIFKDKS
ncbi:hypothetical protein [Dongia rigui]|uniref:Uncharacterized protein n=1 Tax=Dongia rigui TaxID=940149 RepID=A0ABU5DZ16_9PROT|nr:hypothetical protein [Dongia rigui]MDY0872179.1 hypothetical protein [Dongia rigui]